MEIKLEREWDSTGTTLYWLLPNDLMPSGIKGRPACWRVDTGAGARRRATGGIWYRSACRTWLCTRPVGHTGRHAAGDGEKIRAVWL